MLEKEMMGLDNKQLAILCQYCNTVIIIFPSKLEIQVKKQKNVPWLPYNTKCIILANTQMPAREVALYFR